MSKSYYPDQNDDRADWWQNIIDVADPIFTQLGFTHTQSEAILADASWGVYLYRTLRVSYEEATTRVIGYANSITDSPDGLVMPVAPVMPTWPTAPATSIPSGLEARRLQWVQMAKNNSVYNAGTMGTALRIEATGTPFDPNTYTSTLNDLTSPAAKQLRFKFGKAYGKIDGVNLYGRKAGTPDWTNLGRFTATPGNVMIPGMNGTPEAWEFYSRAVKRDIEIGNASPMMGAIIPN